MLFLEKGLRHAHVTAVAATVYVTHGRALAQGHCYFVGVGHSGAVNRVAVTPDKEKIVSVGAEGGIFVWDYCAPKTLADL